MSRRLREIPGSWPELVRELCTAEYDKFTIMRRVFAFEHAVQHSSDTAWQKARNKGFLTQLTGLIEDEFLCGFTREQLVSPQGAKKLICVTSAMKLFSVSVGRALKDARLRKFGNLKDVLHRCIAGIFAKLWDLRDSFLIGKFQGHYRSERPPKADLDNFHDALLNLGLQVEGEPSENRTGIRIPHVFLPIWLYSPVWDTRAKALASWARIINANSNREAWSQFFNGAIRDGCTSNERITGALVRDLANEHTLQSYLQVVMGVLRRWNEFNRSRGVDLSSLEPQLPHYCLAAARRQRCRGNEMPGTAIIKTVESSVLTEFSEGWTITPGRQSYAFLDLLLDYTLSCTHDCKHAPVKLIRFTEYALAHIRDLAEDSSPEAIMMRWHTFNTWVTVDRVLKYQRLPEQSASWRSYAQLWSKVKALIPPMPDGRKCETPFGKLERCCWELCHCNRHKPAHKMRICKRCQSVVYCGEECQRR
ncbi:zinc finger MYND domain-containing protein [Phanerochaete sordida]|uniref:Zinc finger MYND domain-containing protein n=1 Tax=Phanerochaete sordida TaxID=48140 RepID=A0A9P3G6N1_9APHY|nr:zinc finger MYND domain-containing protein [Phanerochaete sordida]